jgi:hypothetical protein
MELCVELAVDGISMETGDRRQEETDRAETGEDRTGEDRTGEERRGSVHSTAHRQKIHLLYHYHHYHVSALLSHPILSIPLSFLSKHTLYIY